MTLVRLKRSRKPTKSHRNELSWGREGGRERKRKERETKIRKK